MLQTKTFVCKFCRL